MDASVVNGEAIKKRKSIIEFNKNLNTSNKNGKQVPCNHYNKKNVTISSQRDNVNINLMNTYSNLEMEEICDNDIIHIDKNRENIVGNNIKFTEKNVTKRRGRKRPSNVIQENPERNFLLIVPVSLLIQTLWQKKDVLQFLGTVLLSE